MCFLPPYANSCSFTLNTSYKMACLAKVGKAVKMLKKNYIYYKSALVTNFVQTCSLISIYKGMYTVCSYYIIHHSEQVRLNYKSNRYNLCARHLQVIVKTYGQHTYLPKTMKYSRPKFYANATLLS